MMTNTKIAALFVGFSVLLWVCLSAFVYAMPTLGLTRFLERALSAHPTLIVMAVFPVISLYMKATTDPMPYRRALIIAVMALVPLLPLTVLAESLNAWAFISGVGLPDELFGDDRNYIISTPRGFILTTFATMFGLGFILPAQVKVRRKKLAKST